MSDPAARPVYDKEDIDRYFDRIRLPPQYRIHDVSELQPEAALERLHIIQKHQLAAVPFEDLSLHYSQHRQISLSPDELYKKIVESGCRGGYCMENNFVFGTLLRSLGYKLYSAGARVNEGGRYVGWSHMVNIVTIGSARYGVDVGFGPNGQTHPLALDHTGSILPQIAPASMRLVHKNISENTNADQRLWVYQHRINDESEWQDMYCFTDLEFLPADYMIMNYFTSTSQKTWFTQKIVCAKMVFGEREEKEELVGAIILQDDLKRRIKGQTEVIEKFETEEDRLRALETHFGIVLNPAEREGINGMASEIKATQGL